MRQLISIGVWYNGIIAVSKTEDVGSIPTAPANLCGVRGAAAC